MRPIPLRDAESWGVIHWARPLISILIDGAASVTEYQVRQVAAGWGESFRYIRLQEHFDKLPDDATRLSSAFDDASFNNVSNLLIAARELMGAQRKSSSRDPRVDLGALQRERRARLDEIVAELARPRTPFAALR